MTIKNSTTRTWNTATLNSVLRELRKLPGVKVVRDYSAGTVIVSGKSKEALRALQQGKGGSWIVRYDSKLIR